MTSAFNTMSQEELMDLHQELSYFVEDYVSKMRNNSDARISQFEKCNTKGTHITCPISGCNNVDFAECNQRLQQKYGHTARLFGEVAADGSGFFVRLAVPIKRLRGTGGGAKARGVPAFQTLISLVCVDALLMGGLYYKLFV